jgi:hypothetical protein
MMRGASLFGYQKWADAAEHLQWCIRRQPDDTDVDNRLKIALTQEMHNDIR